jgi:DNA-binding NtrC family response regulator
MARILVVDDDPTSVAVLERALGSLGYGVEGVFSAEAALGRLERERFDLLIADKNMPAMDGLSLIRELRGRGNATAVILITGFGSQGSAAEALNLGIESYLEKPFPAILEVGRLVEKTIGRQRAKRFGWPGALPGAASPRASGPPLDLLVAAIRPQIREKLVAHLDGAGDHVVLARAARETLGVLERSPPDLVIVDAPSFGREAIDLVSEVRFFAPDLPCLVIGDAIDLATTKALIDLEVLALLHSSETAKLNQVLIALRREKLIRSGRPRT